MKINNNPAIHIVNFCIVPAMLLLSTIAGAAPSDDIMTIIRPGAALKEPARPAKKTEVKKPIRKRSVKKPAAAKKRSAAAESATAKTGNQIESGKPAAPQTPTASTEAAQDITKNSATPQSAESGQTALMPVQNEGSFESESDPIAGYTAPEVQPTVQLPAPDSALSRSEQRPVFETTPQHQQFQLTSPAEAASAEIPPAEAQGELTLQGPESPDSIALEAGINLFNAGEYNAAIERFNQFLAKYPESQLSDQTALWLARSHLKNNDGVEALMQLDKIAEDSGEYPSALYLRGKAYSQMKENESARQAYHQTALLFPGSENADNALYEMAKLYLQDGNGERAIASVVQIIQQYPESDSADDALYLAGKVYETDSLLRDVEKARLIYKKFISLAETENIPLYRNSPLLERVRRDYNYLQRIYFNQR